MGADRGIHICDDRLQGADVVTTAKVLAAAVRTVADVDLVLAGNATTDGQASAVPGIVADLLGPPQVTHVRKLDAPLPALVSVTEKINEPRYPSFKGIMAAKKKPVATVDLDDLFSAPVSWKPSRVRRRQPESVSRTTARPPRS